MQGREQLLKWLRYYALFRPLAALPAPLAYRGADLIGRGDRRRRQAAATAVADGLRRALPQLDEVELERVLRAHFVMLARELTDAFYIRRARPAARLARLAPGSLAALREAKRDGRGAIVAMGHYGRVNMLLLALALAGERVGMLTMATDHRNPDLDAIDRGYLSAKIGALLRHVGGPRLHLGGDLRGLYRALEQGATLVILADAPAAGTGLAMPFLSGNLTVPRGIARLAARTGAAVLYGVARERGRYVEAELQRMPDGDETLRRVLAALERDVRAAPWLWWQWGFLDYIWAPSGVQR